MDYVSPEHGVRFSRHNHPKDVYKFNPFTAGINTYFFIYFFCGLYIVQGHYIELNKYMSKDNEYIICIRKITRSIIDV